MCSFPELNYVDMFKVITEPTQSISSKSRSFELIYNGLNGDNYKSGNTKLSKKPSSDSWTKCQRKRAEILQNMFLCRRKLKPVVYYILSHHNLKKIYFLDIQNGDLGA